MVDIEVQHVDKAFGDFQALDDVSLKIPAGSLLALLGPSGSGKSTLLRVIAGLEEPDEGTILIDNQRANERQVHQRKIGFVFQHYAVFPHMTVAQNIAFGLKIQRQKKDVIRKRVEELLELVQLSAFAKRYPNQLSGGQKQRMVLARALATKPEILLLDEPFGALDAQVRKELRTWLRTLHQETHVTTVFVTHDQEEAMDIATEIAIIRHGKIEQVGCAKELYDQPKNNFVMSFLGAATHVKGRYVRPHDWDIQLEPSSQTSEEAIITRIVYLGFEVRVEFTFATGENAWAQITSERAAELELQVGQIIFLRLLQHQHSLLG